VDPVAPVGTPAFNDWDLTSLSSLPSGALAAAAVVLVVAVALSWNSTRGAPMPTRAGLLALRVLLAVAVFVVLLEPGRRLMATSREPDRVVVAVDVSASMSVGEGDRQRARIAARAARTILDDLATREPAVVPELWFFDDEMRAGSTDDLASLAAGGLPPVGRETRLALPVQRADDASAGDDAGARGLPLGGVIIISDGADTGGLIWDAIDARLAERAGR